MPKIYLTNSNIPKQYLKEQKLTPYECDLQAYTRLNNVKNDIVNFVNTGNNLFIYSKITGNGKTSWAIKIQKAYLHYASNYSFDYDCPTYFMNVARLLDLKKSSMGNPEINMAQIESFIKHSKLMIWDDIAVRGLSDYDKEYLYTLVDERITNGRSNIYTSNLTPKELEDILGARLYSRIINVSIPLEFYGGDRRTTY